LAFWKIIAALFAACIFIVLNSPLCQDGCVLLSGGFLIGGGAMLWFLAGLTGFIFPPPDAPDPDRPVLASDAMNISVTKEGSSPFAGVEY